MRENTFLICISGNLHLQVFNKTIKNITMQVKLPDVDPSETLGYFLSLKPIEVPSKHGADLIVQKYFLVRDETRLIFL
jgi:hypothetical protein